MSAQRGRDLLLKIDDGTGVFATVAGMRTQRLALNADTVDITSAESTGRWRELLAGAGVRRASVSGSGVFKDQASDELVRRTFFDGTIMNWQSSCRPLAFSRAPFRSPPSTIAENMSAKSPSNLRWNPLAR